MQPDEIDLKELKEIHRVLLMQADTEENTKKVHAIESQIKRQEAEEKKS